MRARFYQQEAHDAVISALFDRPESAPLVAIPTGGGKSLIIAMLCRTLLTRYPTMRITVAVHVKELVAQDSATLSRYWPDAPYGIYSASLGLKQAQMPITFCTIQSAVKHPELFGKQHVLIVDEVQMVSPDDETNYQKFIAALKKVNPLLRIVGLSATIFRLKQGMLTDDGIFNEVCYNICGPKAFVKLIQMGYLCPLFAKPTKFQYDLSKVKTSGGDYNQKDLQKTVDTYEQTEKALNEALQVAHDRNHWLVFCSGIEHVEHTTQMLLDMGEKAAFVHSKMSDEQRDEAIKEFREYKVRILVNDAILTVGVDFPFLDCIVMMKPTKSIVRHIQTLGRGCRPFYADGFDLETIEGRLDAIRASPKQSCRVLDFGGNIARNGTINDPKIPKKKGQGTGDVPVKICPACDNYCHAAARFCDDCGYEFKFSTKIEARATSTRVITSDRPVLEWFDVLQIEYQTKTRPHMPSTMLITYTCLRNNEVRKFFRTVSLEATSGAAWYAQKWWRQHLPPGHVLPDYTAEGMQLLDKIIEPKALYVQTNLPHPNILAESFDGTKPYIDDADKNEETL